jgi:serine/threonine protein kinase
VSVVSGPDPLLGSVVGGRYRIRSRLGAGGMAVVYDAIHEELGREFAVKVVSVDLANHRGVIERFLKEARTVAALGHPNIVEVYDLGRLPDDRPYLVMERLHGRNFGNLLEERGPLPLAEVVQLLSQVAAALELVHHKGIVHRDIKLENLMLCRKEDGTELVKVLDFGIAAMLDPARGLATTTSQGNITGTPLYMAPEAIFDQVFDRRADVYSLAVVAYFLLTGQPPFVAADLTNLIRRKLLETPMPLSSFGVTFGPELEAAVARGLGREPKERFDSAKALVQALEPPAPPAPPREPTPSPITTPSPPAATPELALDSQDLAAARAPRWPWIVGGLVAFGLAALITTMVRPPAPAPVSTQLAVAPSPAEGSPVHAPDPTPAPTPPLPKITPARPPPPAAAAVESAPTPKVSPPPPPPPQVVEVAPDVRGPKLDRAKAEADSDRGTQALLKGYLPEAIEAFRAATQAAPNFAPAWRGLGLANERMGRRAEAIEAFRRYLRYAPQGAESEVVRTRLARLEAAPQ